VALEIFNGRKIKRLNGETGYFLIVERQLEDNGAGCVCVCVCVALNE